MRNSDHWHFVLLKDVAEIQTGISKSASRQGDLVKMPYLRVANVQDGRFDLSEVKEIEVPKSAIDRFRVRSGDVLLTEGGDSKSLGRGAVWQGQIRDCVHQNHVFVVRPNPLKLDEHFLAYQTQGPAGRAYFQSCSKQSTNLASINSTQLRNFPTALPLLAEQRKIADILGAWSAALEKFDALIFAKERHKKALMQQLITGKKRVQGAKGKWRDSTLHEMVIEITRTMPKPRRKFLAAGIRSHGKGVFLKPNFNPGDIALDELFKIKAGDLIVNITFAWEGAAAIVPEEADGALVSHRFPTFLFREGVSACSFFRHYIQSKRFVFDCGLSSPGGAGRNRVLSKTAFLGIKLKTPPFEEQQQIGAILDAADKELTIFRRQRFALDQQKRGLMQRLLTGKIRITL